MKTVAAEQELARLARRISDCRRCPRLVSWRERVAHEKRAAFASETYWGRGVPGLGDAHARLLIVGLAPAAHGANRTGRMFTGDNSGRWLFRALHRAGFVTHEDPLQAQPMHTYITAVVRCAPPNNRPTVDERDRCLPYLARELELLVQVQAIVALGQYAYDNLLRLHRQQGYSVPSPKPRFRHGISFPLYPDGPRLFLSYHPSQQNTFTGRLTEESFDALFQSVREYLSR